MSSSQVRQTSRTNMKEVSNIVAKLGVGKRPFLDLSWSQILISNEKQKSEIECQSTWNQFIHGTSPEGKSRTWGRSSGALIRYTPIFQMSSYSLWASLLLLPCPLTCWKRCSSVAGMLWKTLALDPGGKRMWSRWAIHHPCLLRTTTILIWRGRTLMTLSWGRSVKIWR